MLHDRRYASSFYARARDTPFSCFKLPSLPIHYICCCSSTHSKPDALRIPFAPISSDVSATLTSTPLLALENKLMPTFSQARQRRWDSDINCSKKTASLQWTCSTITPTVLAAAIW
ncbi:hypothetical protein BST61_g37 [Cercospora zeina]